MSQRGPRELGKKGNLLKRPATDQFLHAIAIVALANARHRSINSDDECIESRRGALFNGGLGGAATAHQIELIEDGPVDAASNVFQFVPGNCRENLSRPGPACGSRRCHFASGVHQATVAYGREQKGKRKIEAHDACT